MTDLFHWLGFYSDNAFPHVDGFWSTPLGLFITFGLTIRSFLKSRSERFLRRIWHTLIGCVWFIAFCGGLTPGFNPHHIVQTVLIMLCVEAYIDLYEHWRDKHANAKTA